jgi:hypothetical protein
MINTVWYQMTKVAYYMAEQRGDQILKYRYVDEIARSLLSNLPTTAHLYVLERLHVVGENHDMWRQVLTELDKLEGLNGSTEVGGSVDGHISRREGEPHEAQQEPSVSDARDTWTPSAPSGVDESAL